jgi:predicted nuclease of restriction endonuclease-like (RecB) superfamily
MELQTQFSEITSLIAQARARAYQAVNKELVSLYWHVGEYVHHKVTSNAWGKSIVKDLADYIQKSEPNIKGFSAQNLWRMKQFYETYCENEKLSTLSRELSWSHNMEILSATNSMEEREFYMKLTVKEKLSFRELQRQINSSYYERVMLADAKLSTMSRELPQDISNTFKDTYVFELLHLPEEHQEQDLKRAIARNITKFLLEFGRDFAFMGEEYPLQVGNQDFAIDLMFYNRSLNCMVAIELKNERFKPEHLGQLNFYLEALDKDIKKEHENPSIGILLCKGKDDTVVEYALNRSLSPTLVADYKTKLPNKALLQQKWEEVLANLENESHEE